MGERMMDTGEETIIGVSEFAQGVMRTGAERRQEYTGLRVRRV
jgi:hypothetical protein